jgi:hypothetical protein
MVTLIVQAGLLPLYWSETLATAVYLRNRIMTNASISGLTPFSTLYPKNRDEDHYSRLRPFGCLCYALVPEEKQENFTTKTRVCLFLGYVWNSRSIYKVIDVVTHHVFTTPSVDFDEYSFLACRIILSIQIFFLFDPGCRKTMTMTEVFNSGKNFMLKILIRISSLRARGFDQARVHQILPLTSQILKVERPRDRDGTSRSWARDGTRHFSIIRHRSAKEPGPIQSRIRAHPIPRFGFPVPSHPILIMGPGRDGTSPFTAIRNFGFPGPLVGRREIIM